MSSTPRPVDDLVAVDVEAELARHCGNLGCRADEDGYDDASFGRFNGAAQRRLVAGMYDDGLCCRNALCPRDQPVVLRARRLGDRTDCMQGADLALASDGHGKLLELSGDDCEYKPYACISLRSI